MTDILPSPRPSSGHLTIIGLGPGHPDLMTPQAYEALSQCTDIFGYGPYVARAPVGPHVIKHISDNREELQRAQDALVLTEKGHNVALVSGGDAGIFAMAAAVFEVIEKGPAGWREMDIKIIPGISALLAAAARIGAPLGHDFCALSLSDNLKPWTLIEKRLQHAAMADFVITLYNPISRARPWQLGKAFATLNDFLSPTTPVIFATAISRPDENIVVTSLAKARPDQADMRTLLIIGSSQTRLIPRSSPTPWVYTPRRILS